jgi:hypothetical protein
MACQELQSRARTRMAWPPRAVRPPPYLLIFSSAGIGLARSIGGEIQRAEVSGGMGGGRRVDGWESEGEMGAQSKPSLFIQHQPQVQSRRCQVRTSGQCI